ncbi:MAG: helix-turn-helix domain-containing protein [Armatimonadota bacterium]
MVENVQGAAARFHEFAVLSARHPDTAVRHGVPLVVLTDTVARHGEWTQRPHVHRDFFSLYLARSGTGVHRVDERAWPVAPGDVTVMRPGMSHRFTAVDALAFDTFHFLPAVLAESERSLLSATSGFQTLLHPSPESGAAGEARWLRLTPDAFARARDLADAIRAEWVSGTPDGALMARTGFLRLLVLLARAARGPEVEHSSRGRREGTVDAALRYIDDHHGRSLRVAEVAAAVFLSPDRFTEVFSAAVGRTPRQHLRAVRVRRAVELLARTTWTVARIASETGFTDAPHLARSVRAETGRTPGAWRARAVRLREAGFPTGTDSG